MYQKKPSLGISETATWSWTILGCVKMDDFSPRKHVKQVAYRASLPEKITAMTYSQARATKTNYGPVGFFFSLFFFVCFEDGIYGFNQSKKWMNRIVERFFEDETFLICSCIELWVPKFLNAVIISKTTTLAGVFLESPSATSWGCILVLCWCSKWYHLRMAGEYWLIAEILACTFSRGFLSWNLFSQPAEMDFPCQLQGVNKIDNMWLLANVRIYIYNI